MTHRDVGDPEDRPLADQAADALNLAGFSRRDFLKGTGALIVTFSMLDMKEAAAQRTARGGSAQGPSEQLDAWIAIGGDGRVTAYTGKCELGQGLYTAQTQLVAEELSVPMSRVTLVQCDTAITPDQGTTAGSQSHPENFNHRNLGQAAATAREALIKMGAERLGAPVGDLGVADGFVRVTADPTRRVGYGDLIGDKKFTVAIDRAAKRRPAREWTVMGTAVPNLHIPAMATGTFEFVHSVRVPGMVHGRVVRPPAIGATLVNADEASVRGLPGLIKLVVKKDFVGVVAEKQWQAVQAARALKTTWTAGTGLPAQATYFEHLRRQKPTRDALAIDSGDVDAALGKAAEVLKSTYFYPHQMHGSLGTSCAVADVGTDKATVWSATQACHPMKNSLAMVLGLQPQNVRVIFRTGSGCYGLNGADAATYDAAVLSQAVGKPVRVQLTRKEEMTSENYGMAFVIDQRIGLDSTGRIVAWDCETWNSSLGGRPGYSNPGNILPGSLLGFAPAAFTPLSPAPAPTGPYSNGNNAVPSYVTGCMGGACGGTGTVKAERVLTHTVPGIFFSAPLRSPARLQNTFAHESFIDEVASHLKADPVAYRLQHLADPRLKDVLTGAARAAKWDTRPSPAPGHAKTGVVAGRGIGCVAYEGDNGYGAVVVEVQVDQATGTVTITRLAAAVDCGPISNPEGVKHQTYGGLLQGVWRALLEEVTWDADKVTSVNWRSYPTPTLGSAMPPVELVLINRPDAEATGAGELSITVAAAAIGNAIFDATGARLREAPFTPVRVKAALAART
ncbi:MAG: molybdopterin cofactor-binding domain-containing protein [Acidobacteriota bacterium]